MISIKNMDKFELKTGDGLKETLPFKWFDREQVLNEVQELGFYSDFHSFRKELAALESDKVLVIADPEEVYGQNWMICLTDSATREMFSLVESELARIEEEKQRREEEEEAKRNVVYEEKPFIPRRWISDSMSETEQEIGSLDARPTRKFLQIAIRCKRGAFGSLLSLSDRDADQHGLQEFRQHKDPNFDLKRREVDIGLQACPSWTSIWLETLKKNNEETQDEFFMPSLDHLMEANAAIPMKRGVVEGRFGHLTQGALTKEDLLNAREIPRNISTATQTSEFRKINSSMQYEYIEASKEEIEGQEVEEAIGQFLKTVVPSIEQALQQNETMDLFSDEFSKLRSEDIAGLDHKTDSYLHEVRNFTDLIYSNGKRLVCVDWHPRSQNIVAVACQEGLSFDGRVELSGKERNAYVLLWSFADLLQPQLVLQSPHEITCFKFNPDQPHFVAGGCSTGQVVLWDLSKAQAELKKRKGAQEPSQNANEEEVAEVEDGENPSDESPKISSNSSSLVPLEPCMISSIDQSHRRPTTFLDWIPADLHVTSHGKLVHADARPGTPGEISHQFLTCAGDGRIIFWDSSVKGRRAGSEEAHWHPLFRCSLGRNGGIGEYEVNKVTLRGRFDLLCDPSANAMMNPRTRADMSGTVFVCTTEEGEIISGDWLGAHSMTRATTTKTLLDPDSGDEEEQPTDEKIAWIGRDHFSSCIELQRSPFFPFMILSVSVLSFNIWKEDVPQPIFSSPISTGTAHLLCAEWSPSRPGVIVIGKSDGTVDVWDFIDQSHKPSVSVPVAAHGLSSIRFRNTPSPSSRGVHRKQSRAHQAMQKRPNDSKAVREAIVSDCAQKNPIGDQTQVLALGDSAGNLHIFEVPRNLRRRLQNEENIMTTFFERELERIHCALERRQARLSEKKQQEMELNAPQTQSESENYEELVEAEEERFRRLTAKLNVN